ncbi:hypothetical protein IQ07DRAFT_211093 [Pyrenochaeta sp. DS3sAY3a]|nr:hypothetical protein IQ07DRAFT_211093 [Pyrenochaeta sp. DS3sAY3a]
MDTIPQRPRLTKPARFGQSTFLITIWSGVALSFCFLCIRLVARVRVFKRLFWDDGFVILAWVMSLLTAADWQFIAGHMYQFQSYTSGRLWPPPASLLKDTEKYYKGSMVVIAFFFASLWSVKLSFLIFFRRLGGNIRSLNIYWWVVFVFTALSFAGCFADTQYWCLVAPLPKIMARCSGDHDIWWSLFNLKLNTALDVVTDCLILSIPFVILWHVRIPLTKKLALASLFSLVLITILFAILRVALITNNSKQPETSWMYLWTSVEQNMAIIVACLGTFRTLFVQDKPYVGPSYSLRQISRNIRHRKKHKHPLDETITLGDLEATSGNTDPSIRTDDTKDSDIVFKEDLSCQLPRGGDPPVKTQLTIVYSVFIPSGLKTKVK